MKSMTKSELITKLAARFPQLVMKDAELSVKAILDAMTEKLAGGKRIETWRAVVQAETTKSTNLDALTASQLFRHCIQNCFH